MPKFLLLVVLLVVASGAGATCGSFGGTYPTEREAYIASCQQFKACGTFETCGGGPSYSGEISWGTAFFYFGWSAATCPVGQYLQGPSPGTCACAPDKVWNGSACVDPPPPGCEPEEPAPYPPIDFVWNTDSCQWLLAQCSTERSWVIKDGWWSQGEVTCQWGCNYVADGATADGLTWFRPGNVSCVADELGPPQEPLQCAEGEDLTAAGTCWPLPCPEGTESVNGACVYLACPEGQIHWGEACVPDCNWAVGEHLEEGVCLPPETCGPGYTLKDGQCVASEPPDYWVDPEPTPVDPPPGTVPWVPGTPPPPGGGAGGSAATGTTTGSIVLTPDGSGGLTGSIDLETTIELDWGDPGTVQGSVFDAPGFRESIKDFADRVKASDLVSSVSGLGDLFPTGGVCPFGAVELFDTSVSLEPACQYWEDVSPTVSFAAYAIWLLLAIRLFLEG